ncbi:MAG: Fic family protein [Alphaproteobacteria bacterium]|jgi:hypothetical protein|nr:Fic family protein [Alphaproteobacteria bacterium]MBP9877654.1 Fic family protein [Alphaproteobacteria bacterium]
MTKNVFDTLPEVFVSRTDLTTLVYRALKAQKLRKLSSRLYTKNMTDKPDAIVKRNLWAIVSEYFPGALIADRTALENAPALDGSICLITAKGKDIKLPGITLRPRRGHPPLDTDLPFVNGLFVCSTARAYLENMNASRSRNKLLPRTLPQKEIEERLDKFSRYSGEKYLNTLRDETLTIAKELNLLENQRRLDDLIGTLMGTRNAQLNSSVGRARNIGKPYDSDRLALFESLFTELRNTPPIHRTPSKRSHEAIGILAFFEAYFSNYIEGTEFEVAEAADIIFKGIIPQERPEDAHDILGTWRLVSSSYEMKKTPDSITTFIDLLKSRHAFIMGGRPDKHPGQFKQSSNRAGLTIFVEPNLVEGTLTEGFDLYKGLETPFQRAVFMMFLVSEVHPFTDGNGRTARVMMNAELFSKGEEKIIIPTVYRANYLSALKALSQSKYAEPLIRTLDFAQKWTASINWDTLKKTEQDLKTTNAFLDSWTAEEKGQRLKILTSDLD